MAFEKNKAKIRRIVDVYLENPRASYEELSRRLGYSHSYVSRIVRATPYLQVLRGHASARLSNFMPLAVKGIKDSLESDNADVKFKSSVKILENENVLGPEKVDLTVNNVHNMTVPELVKLIKTAKELPEQVIDAEIIS